MWQQTELDVVKNLSHDSRGCLWTSCQKFEASFSCSCAFLEYSESVRLAVAEHAVHATPLLCSEKLLSLHASV